MPPSRRKLFLSLAALAAASIYYASIDSYSPSLDAKSSQLIDPNADDEQYRRRLSKALSEGRCVVTRGKLSETPIPPTWAASFPGSGARMTFFFIDALTGILTNSDYDPHDMGYERVISVKTHYPVNNVRGFPELETKYNFPKALLVIRHPKDAIPSLFNLHWEQKHRLPNHSTRGPQSDWLKYRDNHKIGRHCDVECNLELFETFIDYWMTKYEDRSNLHVVSYEDMTNVDTGPQTALSITKFLGRTEGVTPIDDEHVPCIWEYVINHKMHVGDGSDTGEGKTKDRKLIAAGKTLVDPASERSGPKIRPYTQEMLDGMIAMLQRLKERYGDDEELGKILDGYIETTLNTPAEEGLDDTSEN